MPESSVMRKDLLNRPHDPFIRSLRDHGLNALWSLP